MAKKSETNGKKKVGIMLSLGDDVKAKIAEAKAKAESALGVCLSQQDVIVGILKKNFGLIK